ncbi:MAG: ATP--guanido phosphotransferase, partial [Candidatus Eremiobacteraeota bacterium]|nr:ATP--guanido phosphotransferase [Candidatus Eremiobacteraeota bacterium]
MILPLDQLDWLKAEGPEGEVVFSTRIRLARNLANYTFPSLGNEEHLRGVLQDVGTAMGHQQGILYNESSKLTPLHLALLGERHLVSPAFCNATHPRALALGDDGRLSVMVNEEDHLRIQLLTTGLQFREAWKQADALDRELERHLRFAFDPQFGYLTSCISNVGTGLRASAMLHLPALAWFNAIDQIVAQVSQVGLTVRGLYGEGTRPDGNLLQISNQITLGPSEADILAKVDGIAKHLVGSELTARQQLLGQYRLQLEDRVWRCLGLLKNARMMESNEALAHLS